MKSLKTKAYTIMTLAIINMFSGCGLLYDCDATENDINTLETELLAVPLVENVTMSRCNEYKEGKFC